MESILAALSVLPMSRGGYGFPKPEMNYDIRLDDAAAAFLGRASCCCDFVWIKQKVVVEYDSNISHLTPNQHAYDKRKYNALNMSGYSVFSITSDNMKNFKSIELTFSNLRKLLGLRPQTASWKKYEAIRRETVHSIVYNSWKNYL